MKTRSRAQPSARPASILRGSAKAPKAVSMTAKTKLTGMPNTGAMMCIIGRSMLDW